MLPSPPSRIAIVGPGAIGCTLLAHLAAQGHDLTACVRTPLEFVEVESTEGVLKTTPRVLLRPDASAAAFDWVFVTTKAYDVDGAAKWLKALVGENTRVAIIQNGVEHVARFSPHVRRDALVPVIIDCPVERTAPGRVRQRGRAVITAPDDAAGRDFVTLFAGTTISATATPDWTSAAWRKLCINAAGAVSAVMLQPSRISHHPQIAELMRGIVREVMAVGRREGAILDESLADFVVKNAQAAPPDSQNSLYADRLAGRPMEIDARNGIVVRLGAKHGIPTPLNATMVALLSSV